MSRHLSTLFGAFPHIFTHFQSFFQNFSSRTFLRSKVLLLLVQRDEKRIKENKKKKTKPICTLVAAHLSSSEKEMKDPTLKLRTQRSAKVSGASKNAKIAKRSNNQIQFAESMTWFGPARHRVSQALQARSLEESERVPRSGAPSVLKECAPESQKSPKRVRE